MFYEEKCYDRSPSPQRIGVLRVRSATALTSSLTRVRYELQLVRSEMKKCVATQRHWYGQPNVAPNTYAPPTTIIAAYTRSSLAADLSTVQKTELSLNFHIPKICITRDWSVPNRETTE